MGRRSTNIEDRRGWSASRGVRIGGGIGGIGIVVALLMSLLFGVNPGVILEGGPGPDSPMVSIPGKGAGVATNDELRDFVSVVLADTEDVWTEVFQSRGGVYHPPRLVLFSQAVQSPCGIAGSAAGPFYCPLDRKVYLDLSFFHDLQARFGAPGDFAQAYVIAHEIGHHVQNSLGISEKVREMQAGVSQKEGNRLSVRLELQADCLAGVWANRANEARRILEGGDVEEALNAASAIGDDRIQKKTQGYVVPDGFTHGTSAQRAQWFRQGLKTGEMGACNTFG
jgi:predicted metalloprotease